MTDETENSIAPEVAEKAASEAVTEINTEPAPTPDEDKTENIAMPESAEKAASEAAAEINTEPAPAPDENKTETSEAAKPGLWQRIFPTFLTFISFIGAQLRLGAKNFAGCSKAVGRGLFGFLQRIGETSCKLISKGSKSLSHGLKTGAKASAETVSDVGGKVLSGTGGVLCKIGKTSWDVLSRIVSVVFGVVFSFLSAVFGAVFGWITKKSRQPLLELLAFIATPFAHAWGGVAFAWLRFKKACKRGFFPAVKSVLNSIWRLMGTVAEIFRFAFSYIAPVLCIAFLIGLVRYASTLQYAISVTYNGSDIGTIENEATFNEAQSLIQDKVTFTEGDQPILVTPKFSVTVLNLDESEKLPENDIDRLSETMIESGDVQIVYAYGFYINGELFGVYSEDDMQLIRDALEARLNMYSTVNAVNVEFEDDIVISEGRFVQDSLTSPEDALELINGGTEVEAYYSVQRGDTIGEICENLGITREEFERDNPDLADGVHRDDIVTYHYIEPHMNVLTSYYDTYEQVIERTTEYVETSRREQYCEILLQHGSDGYENVTALVTLTNGVESDRVIVSRTVLEEMVPRKFRVGTKENTYLDGDTTIIDKLGTFCWPLGDEDCYISTMPGWRSWDRSNHMALDIAGIPRGTDIYAACDGTVTFSGWYADYGELVIVDCGSGYKCYYGHCSKLLVEEGDKVEKGDTIAEVGMTGSASGNHLHFEMRYHDERINPLKALGGTGGHEIRE